MAITAKITHQYGTATVYYTLAWWQVDRNTKTVTMRTEVYVDAAARAAFKLASDQMVTEQAYIDKLLLADKRDQEAIDLAKANMVEWAATLDTNRYRSPAIWAAAISEVAASEDAITPAACYAWLKANALKDGKDA